MEWVLDTADLWRRRALRQSVRLQPLRAVWLSPAARLGAMTWLSVATSAVLALWQPFFSLWLGAALFGVPHLVNGWRHAAVHRSLFRTTRWLAALACALGVAAWFGAGNWALLGCSLCFSAGMALESFAARRWALRIAGAGLALAVGAAFVLWPYRSAILLGQLHAVGSLAWLFLAARRRGLDVGWPLLVALGAMAAALCGALDTVLPSAPAVPTSAAESLAATFQRVALPGASALAVRRALFVYAFGQSLHYALWVRLVPEIDRPARVPQSFRCAWQRFRSAFGWASVPLLLGCIAAPALMLLGGNAAREAYFSFALFHMGLEAASLVRLVSCSEETNRSSESRPSRALRPSAPCRA